MSCPILPKPCETLRYDSSSEIYHHIHFSLPCYITGVALCLRYTPTRDRQMEIFPCVATTSRYKLQYFLCAACFTAPHKVHYFDILHYYILPIIIKYNSTQTKQLSSSFFILLFTIRGSNTLRLECSAVGVIAAQQS
jgi:hypothetical protein